MYAAMPQTTAEVEAARCGSTRGLIGFSTAAMMNVEDCWLSDDFKLIQSSREEVIK